MYDQGSDGWRLDRCKKITASRLGDVLANPKTKRYQDYKTQLVEELKGIPQFETEKPWFAHGKANESQARSRYEFETDSVVTLSGFIVHPDFDYIGGSPDGLIGKKGGIEIKCRKSITAYYDSFNKLPPCNKPQVQGSIWIYKLDWMDFVNFFKNEETRDTKINIFRVEPDLKYHKKLENACIKFWEDVQDEL